MLPAGSLCPAPACRDPVPVANSDGHRVSDRVVSTPRGWPDDPVRVGLDSEAAACAAVRGTASRATTCCAISPARLTGLDGLSAVGIRAIPPRTDEHGITHWTDRKDKVPECYRSQAQV